MRSSPSPSPPKPAVWLVRHLERYRANHAMADDMREVFTRICRERGYISACVWYWMQSLDAIVKNTFHSWKWRFIMFKSYMKIALRNIQGNKWYSLINISGLALGLACFILVSLFVKYELSYDKHHKHSNRIFRIINYQPEKNYMNSDYFAWTQGPLAPTLIDRYPEVESAVRINRHHNQLIIQDEDSFLINDFYFADPEIFDIFTLELLHGNAVSALNNPDSIIISDTTARKIFGNKNPMGKILKHDNLGDLVVTGVLQDMPKNSHFRMESIVPFNKFIEIRELNTDSWTPGWYCYTYCLLKEGAQPEVLEEKLVGLSEEVYKKNNIESRLKLQPIERIHLYSHINGEISDNGDIKNVIVFFSIAFLVLIIACINYMNLGTAQSAQRGREVGVRKVVGAQQRQLVMQFLGESIVLTFIAFILALALVGIVLPAFNVFFERDINLNTLWCLKYSLLLLAFILFTGIASGSYPAFIISSFKPIASLRGTLRQGTKGFALRSVLVVFQFSISIILIISTLVVKSQLVFIENKDVGFTKDRIVVLRLRDRELRRNKETIKTKLLNHPRVLSVAGSNYLPNNMTSFNRYPIPDSSDKSLLTIYTAYVDYDFINLFNIQLTQGRNFSRDFVSDQENAVLINESAARALGWNKLEGQRLKHRGERYPEIVGVLKDFNFQSLHNEISPLCLYLSPTTSFYLSVKIKGNEISKTLKYIQGRIEAVSSDYPFEYQFFDDVFDQTYRNEQKLGSLFMTCAFLAVFIACLGLLGLVAFTAEQRTKEIGIRKVLGASTANIILLLSKQFLKWIILANILSWPVAYYAMHRWLQNFAYRVNIGIGIFVASTSIAFFIALTTLSYQSVKAATSNPVDALRYE